MNKKDFLFRVLTDGRILIVVGGIAFLWRAVVSADAEISSWESACSGVSLFIIGWLVFAHMYSMSAKPTEWPVSNRIYRGIAFSVLVLNFYIMIYYGMRWGGLLRVEVSVARDFVFRDVRYVLFVAYYCIAIALPRHLQGMHEHSRLRSKERPGQNERTTNLKAALFRVLTHERTLVIIIAAAILWRVAITIDNVVTFWESTFSGISLVIIGWFLFGYLVALSVKVKRKMDLTRTIQGIALGLCAINVYAIFYYGMRWYGLIGRIMGEVEEEYGYVPQPGDFVFRGVRYVMLVLFYCTTILLTKHLVKAYEDYTVPARKS